MPSQTPNLPPRDDSADWEAIARFFAGESTPDEAAAVRRWLDAHPDEAAALQSLDSATALLRNATPPGLDVEAALDRVKQKRDSADVIPIGRPRTHKPTHVSTPARRWDRFAIPAAAAAVLALAVGLKWHSLQTRGYTNSSGAAATTYATTIGQRNSVRLADGTRVVLAPDSRLTVAMGYGDRVREVELTGEAYFDVHHDAAHPFIVHAGGADIRDIGTTFTVRSTGDQSGVRVVVTSGSVSLAAQGAPNAATVLQPGDAATLAVGGQTRLERGGAVEPDTAWTTGRLVFREAPVSTVRAELRRWYGVNLTIDSSFASRHLSMTFDGENADRVLEVIALSLGAEVQRQGNAATIKPASPRAR